VTETRSSDIGALLQETIGVDVAIIGSSALANAVKRRQAVSGVPDLAIYEARLRALDEELQALIDAVVVPETWFFRDRDAFAAMASLLPRKEARPSRLLSLPCATGEEPYSMAVTLLAAGFAPDRFVIEAVDVSVTYLSPAARATYGENAFRGCDPGLREEFFELAAGEYRPVEAVRRQVDRMVSANRPDWDDGLAE
jgi:chemotaxis protein methyltransferase WspC